MNGGVAKNPAAQPDTLTLPYSVSGTETAAVAAASLFAGDGLIL
jgi:hypothetical protein